MENLRKKDIKKIRELIKEGKSELNINIGVNKSYVELLGYVSMNTINLLIKEGYFVYHSKLNDSALMVCRK